MQDQSRGGRLFLVPIDHHVALADHSSSLDSCSGSNLTESSCGHVAPSRVDASDTTLRWQRGCYSKYGWGSCHQSACPYLHDLTTAEADQLLNWKKEEHHYVFQSDASNSNSCHAGDSSTSNEVAGRDAASVPVVDAQMSNQQLVRGLRAQFETTDDNVLSELVKKQTGSVTSIGSLLHSQGSCRPCRYVISTRPCPDGLRCGFCHLLHDNLASNVASMMDSMAMPVDEEAHVGKRPCKTRREKYRKLVAACESQIREDPFGWSIESVQIPPSINGNLDLKNKFLMRLMSIAEEAQQEAQRNAIHDGTAASSTRAATASSSTGRARGASLPDEVAPQRRIKKIVHL